MKSFFLIVIFIFFLSIDLLAKKENILVIESYHAQYPWDKSYKEGLTEVLGDKYNLVFFEMNTKRIEKSQYEKMANLAWKRYLQLNPILVILGDDNALQYLGYRFVKTNTKVVYLGINNNPRNYSISGYKHISGILERPLLKRSLIHISKLTQVKKVLLLFDSGTTSKVTVDELFLGKTSLNLRGIQVDIKLLDKFVRWQKVVNNSKKEKYDILIVGLYHTIKDRAYNHMKADDVLTWTSKNTPIPLFAVWDFSVGWDKAIGGYVLFGKEQGLEAGKMALKMLSHNKDSLIMPKTAKRGRFLFSTTQLKKWNLNPEGKIKAKIEYIK